MYTRKLVSAALLVPGIASCSNDVEADGAPVTTLTELSLADVSNYGLLAQTEGYVYWTEPGKVRRIAKIGGEPQLVDTQDAMQTLAGSACYLDRISSLAANGTNVVYACGGLLFLRAETAQAPRLVATTDLGRIDHLVLTGDAVYGALNAPNTNEGRSFVFRVPISGGPLTELFRSPDNRGYGTLQVDAPELAVSNDAVFALDEEGLVRYPLDGVRLTGTGVKVADAHGTHAASDGTFVYQSNGFDLERIDPATGTTVNVSRLRANGPNVIDFDIHSERAWFSTSTDLWYGPKDGSGVARRRVASMPHPAERLVVDDRRVYFIAQRDGGIMAALQSVDVP